MQEEVIIFDGWLAVCIEDEYFTEFILSLLYRDIGSREQIENDIEVFCKALMWIDDKKYNKRMGFSVSLPEKEQEKKLKLLNKAFKKYKLNLSWGA